MSRLQADTFYHIYNHANGNENLFRSPPNYDYFLRLWYKYVAPIADTYAYCLMPNHFHTLIRLKGVDELKDLSGLESYPQFFSQQFSHCFNSYAKAFNLKYERKGSLFSRPFKSKAVESDSYFSQLIYYIHHNPVRHGFVKNISHWRYSSYLLHILHDNTIVNCQYVLNWFGGVQAYIHFHESHQGDIVEELERE